MRVLLDECVPWPMHRLLFGHESRTAQQCGWGGLQNGDLLRKTEGQFEAFVTADQDIRYQQNLRERTLPILELSKNDRRQIHAASVAIQAAVSTLQPGDYLRLEIP